MSTKPVFFKLPLSRFDLDLLPADARQTGTEAFKDAVIAHFAEKYALAGQQAFVSVDADEIQVFIFPEGSDPLEFVLTMLQAGRIKEAVPHLEAMTKVDPDNAQVLYNLGISYRTLCTSPPHLLLER